MNTSCESTSTLELRELSLAASAAIGRCWQSTDWPTTKFVTGFCALLADAISHIPVMPMTYQESPTMHDINVVRGKLNFLRMVKGVDDPTYIAYTKKLNMAVKGKHFA